MQLSRRHLLALASLGAVAAGVGASLVGLSWWDRAPGEGYRIINDDESGFIRAFAGATWPATESIPFSGSDLQLDHFFDESLGHLGHEPRTLIRVLLHALESSTLPSRLSVFSSLDLETQQEVIQRWLRHLLPEIRQAAQSLCILTGTGYTTHPDVSPFFEAMHGCIYGR